MEIGQNPIDQGYAQQRPLNATEQRQRPQEATLESGQAANQSVQQTETTATSGSVGRNIDTYV